MRFFLAFLLAGLIVAPLAEARMHAGPPVMHGQHRIKLPGGALDGGFGAPASAAYSFRKLRAAYAGKAVQLRRASDNAVLDIGFTAGGDFDTAAAATFCNATSCFVGIWYDQSGNGRDVTAAGATQPAQVFNCNGALPCMRATATAQVLQTPLAQIPVSPVSFSAVANRGAGTGLCYWPIQYPGNSLSTQSTVANTWLVYAGSAVAAVAADAAWHAGIGVINGASSVIGIDGVETAGTATVNTTAGSLVTFWGSDTATCNVSEVIVWNGYALTPAERAALTANQRAYWGF